MAKKAASSTGQPEAGEAAGQTVPAISITHTAAAANGTAEATTALASATPGEPALPAKLDIDKIADLKEKKRHYEQAIRDLRVSDNKFLSYGVPALLLVLVVVAIVVDLILVPYFEGTVEATQATQHFIFRFSHTGWVLAACFLVLAMAGSGYFFGRVLRLRSKMLLLEGVEEEIQVLRVSTEAGRRQFLQEEMVRLANKTAKVFFENEDRYAQAVEWRTDAVAALNSPGKEKLDEAQAKISSLSELVAMEKREREEQRYWRYAASGLIIAYIWGVAAAILLYPKWTDGAGLVPVFDIPASIILWGAVGSLAAILYRFYSEKNRIRLSSEIRWLIARPVIGIIMGAVAYVALKTGLFLFDTSSGGGGGVDLSEGGAVFGIVAFLAGFSDRFYLGIINVLVERAIGTNGKDEAGAPQGKANGVKENGGTENRGTEKGSQQADQSVAEADIGTQAEGSFGRGYEPPQR